MARVRSRPFKAASFAIKRIVRAELEVAELGAGWGFSVGEGGDFGGTGDGGAVHIFFDGAADEVARAEANGEGEGEDDSSKENAES